MVTFDNYEISIADEAVRSANWPNIWRLGVVVFTRPEDRMCKDVIGPSLRYLHELTGDSVHFYFVGFFDRKGLGYETSVSTDFEGDGRKWYFSPAQFSKVQKKFEDLTHMKWGYSGATDLLNVPYRIRKYVFYVDASSAIDLKLSKLVHEKHHYMPEELVQILVRAMRQGKDIDGVSNSRIMDAIKIGLKESFLSWLPGGVVDSFKVLEPFAVRNLT